MPDTPPAEPADLLRRHCPVVRYDSQEPYFADSAAEWTDNEQNRLLRADGTLIAAALPADGEAQLALSFLRSNGYGDGSAAGAGDRIDDRTRDYQDQARSLHARPEYRNRVYGHWATGSDGRVWLAYWFFYFYNDYNLIGPFIKAGLHEGDWEMIQLRLDPAGAVPDLAVYAQHNSAAQRPWARVERVGDQPVVYSARGSHASYFTPGSHHWNGHWFDHADGKRPAPQLTLDVIRDGDRDYHWVAWPGMWGGTTPPPGDRSPLNSSSPRGPGAHAQWRDPTALLGTAQHAAAAAAEAAPPPAAAATLPGAPSVTISRAGEELRVDYATTAQDVAGLIITLNSPQDPLPPEAHRVAIDRPRGTVDVPLGLHDDWSYDVHISVVTAEGQASAAAATALAPAG